MSITAFQKAEFAVAWSCRRVSSLNYCEQEPATAEASASKERQQWWLKQHKLVHLDQAIAGNSMCLTVEAWPFSALTSFCYRHRASLLTPVTPNASGRQTYFLLHKQKKYTCFQTLCQIFLRMGRQADTKTRPEFLSSPRKAIAFIHTCIWFHCVFHTQ